jgi:dTDP-4-dehydrorhamnose reductase
MKALVLGSSGMAGHMVTTYLSEKGYSVDNLSSKTRLNATTILLDITDKNLFADFLDTNNYDVIINCVGILVEQSETRKDLSTYLNSFLPHYLEQKYRDSKTRIIHLSTDCVFSGKNSPYKEDSFQDGELFYDRTKAIGEINNGKDLTFRMSVIGPDISENGVGLFNWFQKQGGEIFGYTDAIWTGVTTLKLAEAIDAAIKQNLNGIYHLVPDKNISKFDLLNIFKATFGRQDITIKPRGGISLDKTLINTRTDFDFVVPKYATMLEEMNLWINKHKDLYPHYFRGLNE